MVTCLWASRNDGFRGEGGRNVNNGGGHMAKTALRKTGKVPLREVTA